MLTVIVQGWLSTDPCRNVAGYEDFGIADAWDMNRRYCHAYSCPWCMNARYLIEQKVT